MKNEPSALHLFHPLIAKWFQERIGRPTELQESAWPRVAAGEHLLITAPTGSGKTLAAFLWAIHQIVSGALPLGRTSVLYVSPLKALNNDIRRNLMRPLEELGRIFASAGEHFPEIRVLTRSGDTPPSERQRMQRKPPDILITTPESLNLLLSSRGGRSFLTHLTTVILDEIHAVAGTKRGVHLIAAIDRLVPLSGEFQRIALSATIKPLDRVSEFVGGYMVSGAPGAETYTARKVGIVCSSVKKRYEIRVRFPAAASEEGKEAKDPEKTNFWQPFVDEVKGIIEKNRSTLLFTNSRRLCEKLTHMINLGETSPVAYAHHGSLSREIRSEVERKLKSGDLRAIVATNSLELGIDIGALEEVVLIQSPPSVSSAVQRVGRAGHQVGEASRGTLLPTHPQDILESAVLASGLLEQDIESTEPLIAPLDVLAQVIVSMTGVETWDLDALYRQVRTSHPYRFLSRRQFDLVLEMLAGRYSDSRIRELKPRISLDRLDRTAAAAKGALQTLYFSGGTIPDRGYFHLRHNRTGSKIGELDEEFVWEAKIGQTFTLGTQNWKIERITHNDVLVRPADPRATAPPFWRAEETLRDFHFSERIGLFLEMLDGRIKDPDLISDLQEKYRLEEPAARRLILFLKSQKEATGGRLPHRHHLLLEFPSAGPGGAPGNQAILHTLWGGRVNRPFAMALEAAWEERFGRRPETYVSNDCVAVQLPHDIRGEELLSMVGSATVQDLLRKRLEGSGFFGARFRECAGRALLLPKRKFQERMPLWMSRLRSRKLLDSVLHYEDFPILLEAWRTCLKDEFDLPALLRALAELESGSIGWSEVRTGTPSPMARSVTWRQLNQYVYMDDTPGEGKTSKLAGGLLREVLYSPDLRPAVPQELVAEFESKRLRLRPGYAPYTPRDLLDWVKERLLIPLTEWESLLERARIDRDMDLETLAGPIEKKLARIRPAPGGEPLITAVENLSRVLAGLYREREGLRFEDVFSGKKKEIEVRPLKKSDEEGEEEFASDVSHWLRFYGPRTSSFIGQTLGLPIEPIERVLEELVDAETLVTGELIRNSTETLFCDSENLESLLRIMRAEARPSFKPLDIRFLPFFLARFQGLIRRASDIDGLYARIERLLFHPAASALWESEILPARAHPYQPSWLDILIQQSELRWIGCGRNRICFGFDSEMELMQTKSHVGKLTASSFHEGLFPDSSARYDFGALLSATGLKPAELSDRLWDSVWEGRVLNDTFAALRKGIETGFKPPEIAATASALARSSTHAGRHRPGTRPGFSKWKGSLPFPGTWRQAPVFPHSEDLIGEEERKKERARLLLDRYGVLFRELLRNEPPPFRWPEVFRSLRLMEISGEVLTGYFFEDIPGPQFASHEAFRMLSRQRPEDAVYWVSAMDPASVCGIGLAALRERLPRRAPGAHIVYCGQKPVLISRGNGRNLLFHASVEDPRMPEILGLFKHLLYREFQPLRRVVIETINNGRAARSPFVEAFRKDFDVSVEYRNLVLFKPYH